MYTALLSYQNAHLTPEARWLLMQWVSIFGLEQSVDSPLQSLFDRLGLTYAQGRRAWQVLTSKQGEELREQFIEIERMPSKGQGRPASRYRISAKLVKALSATQAPSCEQHAKEIALLAKTTRLSGPEKKVDLPESSRLRGSGLTLPNRWLLMVLLAHGDSPGMVTRLSVSAMHRLTGMSRYRINNQLTKLSALGFIAHYQPGQYASQPSERKTSIYLLDLAHPLFKNSGRECVLMHLPLTRGKTTYLWDGIIDAVMAAGVCGIQIEELNKKYYATDSAKRFTHQFNAMRAELPYETLKEAVELAKARQADEKKIRKVMNHALELLPDVRYLKAGIEKLLKNYDSDDANQLLVNVHSDAMLLLSTSWTALKNCKLGPEEPDPKVITGIMRRFGLNPEHEVWPTSSGGEELPHNDAQAASVDKTTTYSSLAILFYALSHHLATQLQIALLDSYDKNISDADYEAMAFTLTLVSSGNIERLYQLRGYRPIGVKNTLLARLSTGSVHADLKAYWRTHRQDYISVNKREPDDTVLIFTETSRN